MLLRQMNAIVSTEQTLKNLISHDFKDRLLHQFPLARKIVDDSQVMERPEHQQCSASADFCGCF